MKTVEEQIREAVPSINIMQLATSVNDQPWLCTVHYISDDDLNFYWISEGGRRHSKELTENNKVAAYVLVHENTPQEDYVIGIAMEGTAVQVNPEEHKAVWDAYVAKHRKPEALTEKVMQGKTPMYRFQPTSFVMFNTRDFPDNSRQEWKQEEKNG
jgi:uncharacterized protein YhbP (UPF0306 family)